MNRNKKGFTLVELLVVIGILGILMGALFPAISSAMIKANLSACGMRGRNLFVAITSANTEREALGLGNVWPKTEAEENSDSANDPLSAGTTSASDYFTKLFHMEKIKDAANWKPYVSGVDISVLSGAGVPASPNGATKVDGKNVQHRLIRRVSMDQFYAIVTGDGNAFYKMCMALPETINEVVNEEGVVTVPQDTVIQELRKVAELYADKTEDLAMAMSVYMLGFNTYLGFCKQEQELFAGATDAMLKRIYEYAKHLKE